MSLGMIRSLRTLITSTSPTSFDEGSCLDEVFLLEVNPFMCELWSSPGLLKIPTMLFSFVFFPSFF